MVGIAVGDAGVGMAAELHALNGKTAITSPSVRIPVKPMPALSLSYEPQFRILSKHTSRQTQVRNGLLICRQVCILDHAAVDLAVDLSNPCSILDES